MAGPAVEIVIAGQHQHIRYNVRTSRMATNTLQNVFLPKNADKLDVGGAATLVARGDQDAIIVFLHAGMAYDNERLLMSEVERMCERHVDGGGDLGDFVQPILDALHAARLIKVNYRLRSGPDSEGDNGGRPTMPGPTEAFSKD